MVFVFFVINYYKNLENRNQMKKGRNKNMANCFECKNAYVEDIWSEWCCRKGHHINTDDEGCISGEYFECEDFVEED